MIVEFEIVCITAKPCIIQKRVPELSGSERAIWEWVGLETQNFVYLNKIVYSRFCVFCAPASIEAETPQLRLEQLDSTQLRLQLERKSCNVFFCKNKISAKKTTRIKTKKYTRFILEELIQESWHQLLPLKYKVIEMWKLTIKATGVVWAESSN